MLQVLEQAPRRESLMGRTIAIQAEEGRNVDHGITSVASRPEGEIERQLNKLYAEYAVTGDWKRKSQLKQHIATLESLIDSDDDDDADWGTPLKKASPKSSMRSSSTRNFRSPREGSPASIDEDKSPREAAWPPAEKVLPLDEPISVHERSNRVQAQVLKEIVQLELKLAEEEACSLTGTLSQRAQQIENRILTLQSALERDITVDDDGPILALEGPPKPRSPSIKAKKAPELSDHRAAALKKQQIEKAEADAKRSAARERKANADRLRRREEAEREMEEMKALPSMSVRSAAEKKIVKTKEDAVKAKRVESLDKVQNFRQEKLDKRAPTTMNIKHSPPRSGSTRELEMPKKSLAADPAREAQVTQLYKDLCVNGGMIDEQGVYAMAAAHRGETWSKDQNKRLMSILGATRAGNVTLPAFLSYYTDKLRSCNDADFREMMVRCTAAAKKLRDSTLQHISFEREYRQVARDKTDLNTPKAREEPKGSVSDGPREKKLRAVFQHMSFGSKTVKADAVEDLGKALGFNKRSELWSKQQHSRCISELSYTASSISENAFVELFAARLPKPHVDFLEVVACFMEAGSGSYSPSARASTGNAYNGKVRGSPKANSTSYMDQQLAAMGM